MLRLNKAKVSVMLHSGPQLSEQECVEQQDMKNGVRMREVENMGAGQGLGAGNADSMLQQFISL